MAKRSPSTPQGGPIDPYRGNAQEEIKNMADQGLISAEDPAELAQELQSTRKHTETSVARVMEGQEARRQAEKRLTPEQQETVLTTAKVRFEANMDRHPEIEWSKVQAKLEASPEKIWSLNEMERTGGEPDVVDYDQKNNEYIFFDCSEESPEGRRDFCYDREGQHLAESYGDNPAGNAVDMAKAMGIEILGEAQYRNTLQKLGKFDRHSWSWLKTPLYIKKTGVALFGYRNGGGVHVGQFPAFYHIDYRGFRGSLRV